MISKFQCLSEAASGQTDRGGGNFTQVSELTVADGYPDVVRGGGDIGSVTGGPAGGPAIPSNSNSASSPSRLSRSPRWEANMGFAQFQLE